MARPTKLTPEVVQQLPALLRKHLYLNSVAAALSITNDCLRKWRIQGRAIQARVDQSDCEVELTPHEERLRDVYLITRKTLADYQAELLEDIVTGSRGWQRLAWLLERRWPHLFGTVRGEFADVVRQLKKLQHAIKGKHARSAPPQAD